MAVRQDLRYAFRILARAPGFTAVAVIVLALGTGANTAMFSVIDALLLRPLPYADPGRLVSIVETVKGNTSDEVTLTPDFLDWRSQNHVFTGMAGYNFFERTLTGAGDAVQVNMVKASASLMPIMGVRVILGRGFVDREDQKGQDAEAILSYAVWQQNYGGRRDVVGGTIRLDDQVLTIVGVLPPEFHFPSAEPVDVLTPLGKDEAVERMRGNGMTIIRNVVARLKPGVTLGQARAEMDTIEARMPKPGMMRETTLTVRVLPLRERLLGEVRPAVIALMGAVGFLLLVACANIASLLLGRAVMRQRELAIRAALGASRRQVAGQLLVESALLAALGCAGGIALAWWVRGGIAGLLPKTIPGLEHLPLDWRVLGFALTSAFAWVLFGLAPALASAAGAVAESMKGGGSIAGMGGRRVWLNLLASSQMAIAIILVTGSGLMLESFWKQRHKDLGFEPEHVLATAPHLSRARYPAGPIQVAFVDRALAGMASLPGVEFAAAGTIPPGEFHATNAFAIEGWPPVPRAQWPVARQPSVSASYFQVMGIPVLKGRGIQESDREGTLPVVVVSETLGRRYFGGDNPVGRRISVTRGTWLTIVGVAGDVKTGGLASAPEPVIYFPYRQSGAISIGDDVGLLTRSSLDPATLAPAVRRRLRELDPGVPFTGMQTLDQHLDAASSRARLAAVLLAAFAGLGLVIAATGLYGAMSLMVRWRRREIGIRLAVGAQPGDVARMILTQSLWLMLASMAAGSACALGLTRLMRSLLYGVSSTDPLAFGCGAAFLLLTGLAAAYYPARQASVIDPAATLRAE